MESLECERRSSAEKKHFLREIRELEVKRDNMISNANLKGKILDSLGSKEAIKTQIKLIRTELDGMKKKQQSVKAEIEQAEKEMEAMEMYIGSLQERLVAINQERKGTVKHLNELRKQCDKAMTCYKEGCCCPRQT
ncbi:proton pump-interactor BIP103-like [Vitis vinifera]|uniref:proton pump-interactor BIP103-like n=1 Tax=Vitis vinifera TaxID=29760 RepID=UPI00053FCE4C|nr:proton pump-interactor BIP103-like [Vitis vinifera]XP_059597284.1 proton pump-interactor BIP103-like [Vitis vinifera]|eukprot:XP_010657115.1 PREDICTED: uncharacterized protein LOC104880841 [Vitis vinifera]